MDVLLLLGLALAGTISGIIGGSLWGSSDALILGGSSGLIFGVAAWVASMAVLRARYEHRLNRYFNQDGGDLH